MQRLIVHAWTFRAENNFLPTNFQIGDARDPNFAVMRGNPQDEVKLFYGLGIDGVFSDNTDIAVAARAGLGL